MLDAVIDRCADEHWAVRVAFAPTAPSSQCGRQADACATIGAMGPASGARAADKVPDATAASEKCLYIPYVVASI